MKIAAWSGPRNLSTAMMYAFAARGDTEVADEPFYAAFLWRTGLEHPMRAEILARHDRVADRVVSGLGRSGLPHLYLKLMAHHMIKGMPCGWAEDFAHLHLIRHPARVIASYSMKRERPSLEDIGFLRQRELYDRFGGVVVDSADLRADPARGVRAICKAIGLPPSDAMLRWPRGGIAADGVWAAHWYGSVHRSTGFAGPEGPLPVLEGDAARLCDRAMPAYEALSRNRLRITGPARA